MARKNTKQVTVGGVLIGGGSPVTLQSMTNTRTDNIEDTVSQITRLKMAGCDIVRVAVPDMEAARAIAVIKDRVDIPVVADIHFDYRLALASAEAGCDKIRINPGNIGSADGVRAVAETCRGRGIPIRIGVNGGSLDKKILEKYGGVTAEAMCESAKEHVELLHRYDFDDILLSLKCSDVLTTVSSYRLASEMFDYPLHLGVTEAGLFHDGVIYSSVGIGSLLLDGIGDTIRVSLTAEPEAEIRAGLTILRAAGARSGGVRVISCPSCGRCEIDLISLATEVEEALRGLKADLTVAVMGCVVNGPGESKAADFGVAGGRDCGILFKKGESVGKVPYGEISSALLKLIESEISANAGR